MVAALATVNTIKRLSETSCPWDLDEFGGLARYVSHWSWGVFDGGGGHCFPGGHVSSFSALLPLVLPALAATTANDRLRGWHGLATLLLASLVLGVVQTLRGAHYPSHTLWTLTLSWMAGGLPWVIWRGWTTRHGYTAGHALARPSRP